MKTFSSRVRSRLLAGSSLALASALLPRIASADPSCDWVSGVTQWSGSFGWSWSHQDAWQEDTLSIRLAVQDVGSGSATLSGAVGTYVGFVEGTLAFDDYYETLSEGDDPSEAWWQHTVLSGAIVGATPGMDTVLVLVLNESDCTYTWQSVPIGAGTRSEPGLSEPTRMAPNEITPGIHTIPPLPGSLWYSGAIPVTSSNPVEDPQFVTQSSGGTSVNRDGGPAAYAFVSWSFDPGGTTLPYDSCAGAGYLAASTSLDTSLATVDVSDPASTCGGDDRSVWFTFFATESGTAQISTAGSNYQSVVSVWPMQEICGELTTEVACGANGASIPVEEGTAYRVQVRRSGTTGGSSLSVSVVPEPGATTSAIAALIALATVNRRARWSSGSPA